MKKNFLFLLFIMYVLSYSYSQTVSPEIVTTSGDFQENSSLSISWTIGEGIIETFENSGIILTQGFQQSKLTVTAVKELQNIKFEISAFPNPVKEFITLKVESKNLKRISFSLYDANGKFILQNEINSNEIEIPFTDYPSSFYFLKVLNGKKEIKTFKIVKLNTE